jgi:hypothetical protein
VIYYHAARCLGVAAIVACSAGPSEMSSAVDRVEVAPASHTMLLPTEAFLQLTATARNAAGGAVTGRSVTWSSSAGAVATVNGLGVVTAVAVGTTVVSATVDGVTGSSSIAVQPAPVASVALSLARSLLVAGETTTASVVVKDGVDHVVSNPRVSIASSNTAVARVTGDGIISGVSVGTALITATSDTRSASALICVTETTPNLRLEFVTLTQSVQTPFGTIPLVSDGLPASVRVHATNSIDLPSGCSLPRFRLVAWSGSTEVLRVEADAVLPLPTDYSP